MFRWWPSNENQQFSGIFKKFCFAIVSTFKLWWWTNMNSVKANWIRHSAKSPGQAEWFSLSWLTISSSTLLLYLWPLITFKFKLFALDCCSFFTFPPPPFFPFPFLIFFSFSFSLFQFLFCHLIVSQFLNSSSWGSSKTDAQSSLTWVALLCTTRSAMRSILFLRPDLRNIFISDLEEVMNSSNLQMTPDWGAPIDTVKGRAANRIDPDSLEELAEKKHEILLGQIQSPAIAKKNKPPNIQRQQW